MYLGLHVKYPSFVPDFKLILGRFSKNIQKLNFMKIRPVGAELFHLIGWTDRHNEVKLIFAILRTRIQMNGSVPLLPLYAFHDVQRNNFTFLLTSVAAPICFKITPYINPMD